MTNEFEYHTVRQQVVNGTSREEFALGRYAMIVCLSLFACAIVLLAAFIFGKSSPQSGPFSISTVQFLGVFFIQGFGYLGFALLVSVFLRRAVIAAGVFLVWPIVAEPILGWILDYKLQISLSDWLPLHVISSVVPQPFGAIDAGQAISTPDISVVGMSLVYSTAMFLLVMIKIRTSDL